MRSAFLSRLAHSREKKAHAGICGVSTLPCGKSKILPVSLQLGEAISTRCGAELLRRPQRQRVLARHRLGAHAGAQGAGIDHHHLERRRHGLGRIGPRHRLDRRLRDRVRPPIGQAPMRRAGGHHDHPAGIGGLQRRLGRLDQPPVGGDVGVEHLGPFVRLDMGQRRQRPEDAGIGEQDVELAPALQQGRAELLDRRRVAEIDRHQRRAAADRVDLVIELFERARGPRQRHDMGAGLGESERSGAADAARGAGDERDAPFERLGHAGIRRDQPASASSDNCCLALSPITSVSEVG